ncbi:phytanoyl-CoA dioxygenase family protein [Candidatus Poribacteria bacterium]|nr:phytanoyl-CoA dioxygenase family protein [Candidatus Poribacteria bacterium]
MTNSTDDTNTDGHYTLTYRILNHDLKDPERKVDVHATPEEIRQLVDEGYLVRERLFSGEQLERLRAALDVVEAGEIDNHQDVGRSRRFGGLFLRHLMDKHPTFLDLLKFQPTLSVARAVLGPLVQIRGLSARISYPGEPNQETHWHFHQRVISDPLPPFFVQPHAIDCLVYLDDINDATGPICFVPGSHRWLLEALSTEDYADKPGQIIMRVPAGSCVIIHSNLWHRALPTHPDGTKRRLLILSYTPTWMKQAPYGVKPANALTVALLKDADAETRELLGVGGYT